MNDWFDYCNSKNPKVGQGSNRVVVTPANGVDIANKFLKILSWLKAWKESVTDATGKVEKEHLVCTELEIGKRT
jgi:hypothetical protein